MDEPSWKQLKLSLERPWRNEEGKPISELLDITPDGEQIYEPPEDPTAKIGENLRRIFLERGVDFFDKHTLGQSQAPETEQEETDKESRDNARPMTPEELFKMRMEILPQLHIALGEMCQARDLLTLLLSGSAPSAPLIPGIPLPTQSNIPQPSAPPGSLTATTVSKPPHIQSVQAFNAQLVVGGKDRALRKAADLLKVAAESVEAGRARSEGYWVDALKIRRGNWGLIPAPLPLGSATGRGTDRTAKDFLVSFGLEESPPMFRRRAISRIPTFTAQQGTLEYPLRQYTRLQVSLVTANLDGGQHILKNQLPVSNEGILEESLRAAQAEVVQQEIFAALIREASNLPTASAQVSERLIVIEAARGTELRFELVDCDSVDPSDHVPESHSPTCDLIFSALHLLLLRGHAYNKSIRLGGPNLASGSVSPLLLQPIVDLLQYQEFYERVHAEISVIVETLSAAGVTTKLRLNPVGDIGEQLVDVLTKTNVTQRIAGETVLRIDNRHTLRFTYSSPSTLTAHLPQANLSVSSISQLTQLLHDEVTSCLLDRIVEIGTELCEFVRGTWFVDLLTGRSIGRWDGRIVNFQLDFVDNSYIVCTAACIERSEKQPAMRTETYVAAEKPGLALLDWVRQTISQDLARL